MMTQPAREACYPRRKLCGRCGAIVGGDSLEEALKGAARRSRAVDDARLTGTLHHGAAVRTIPDLWDAIADAIDKFHTGQMQKLFAAAGCDAF
jgi:hypothetical protein